MNYNPMQMQGGGNMNSYLAQLKAQVDQDQQMDPGFDAQMYQKQMGYARANGGNYSAPYDSRHAGSAAGYMGNGVASPPPNVRTDNGGLAATSEILQQGIGARSKERQQRAQQYQSMMSQMAGMNNEAELARYRHFLQDGE